MANSLLEMVIMETSRMYQEANGISAKGFIKIDIDGENKSN